jgi:hypothetical protein
MGPQLVNGFRSDFEMESVDSKVWDECLRMTYYTPEAFQNLCPGTSSQYIGVSMVSTGIYPCCGPSFGLQGRGGLKVRQWVCKACVTLHDRNDNAQINIPVAGVGTTHRRAA